MDFRSDVATLATHLQRIAGELRDLAAREGSDQDRETEHTLNHIHHDLQKLNRELLDVSRNLSQNIAQNRPRRPSGWGGK